MFEYFEDNFGWSFMVNKVIAGGGAISEIDRACRPLRALATRPEGYEAWIAQWSVEARRVRDLALRDLEAGNEAGAGHKLWRSAMYAIAAEARTRSNDVRRVQSYSAAVEAFVQGARLLGEPLKFVDVPYEGTTLPAIFTTPPGAERVPCVILLNGFDSVKEFNYLSGLPSALRQAGIATLLIDHPGTGGALRLQHLKGMVETERPVGAAIDYLLSTKMIDPERVGVAGISLGGYYAPRAAAFDSRLHCCVAWGAIWDYGALCRERLSGGNTGAVYADWLDQFKFVFGEDLEEAKEITSRMTLEGVASRIECPVLIVHGASDRQVPISVAQKLAEAVDAAPVTLKIFNKNEGGIEHSQVDNMSLAVDYISHWVAKTFRVPSRVEAES